MNLFTVTFKNADGILTTEDFELRFNGVSAVIAWFEETFALRVKSITKQY